MLVKEFIHSDKYIINIRNHSNEKKCSAISTLACFSNFLLNGCDCGFEHVVSLKKGKGYIEINTKCNYYLIIKKIFSYMKVILKNELV